MIVNVTKVTQNRNEKDHIIHTQKKRFKLINIVWDVGLCQPAPQRAHPQAYSGFLLNSMLFLEETLSPKWHNFNIYIHKFCKYLSNISLFSYSFFRHLKATSPQYLDLWHPWSPFPVKASIPCSVFSTVS